jgi:hypothetical protein
LLQSAAADMKGRVRKTAFKWSENNKTGASFPPKHKVLMINQDDEDAEENEEEDQTDIPKPRMQDVPLRSGENTMGEQITNLDMSPGTYRNNIQTNDFDEVGKLIDNANV